MSVHVFSYVVRHDHGFAPNPFGGLLTLATCKPTIRRVARVGDYLFGTGSVATVGNDRLVYAGIVSSVVPIEDYGRSRKYTVKRPSTRGEPWKRRGDNIYALVDGKWKRRRNFYHGKNEMARDLSGVNVLVCDRFWYFGEDAVKIPSRLHGAIKKGPGHKRVRDPRLVRRVGEWLESLTEGLFGQANASGGCSATTCAGQGGCADRPPRTATFSVGKR